MLPTGNRCTEICLTPSARSHEVVFPWCGTTALRSAEAPHSAKAAQRLLPTRAPGLRLLLLKPKLGKAPHTSIFILQSDFWHNKTHSQFEIGI